MPCYHPIQGFQHHGRSERGTRPVVFRMPRGRGYRVVQVPCGQCIGCRLERSRQWAVRCLHEASLHEANSFLTLTYDDDHLPSSGSLDKSEPQKFFKRLRHVAQPFRYFMCGEYGDELSRPHYHVILFGEDFYADRRLFRSDGGGSQGSLYRSATLERLWPFGFSTIGSVSFESAAYVARYACKKVTGELARDHYEKVDRSTGEISRLEPEYSACSLKPAIGKGWIEKYMSNVYSRDSVVVRGREMLPPKFYDKLHAEHDWLAHGVKLVNRVIRGLARASERSPERLEVREEVAAGKLSLLRRDL